MGADQSNQGLDQFNDSKLKNEINDYINGEISKDSLRYQFFLMSANHFFNYEPFYLNVEIHKIADYLNDLVILDIKEAKTIIQQIIKISNCEEATTFNLQIILPNMRIKYKDRYISPLSSKDLFNQVFSASYKTQWGKYSPNSVVDWESPYIEANYSMQSQETLQQLLQRMSQLNYFIKEKKKNSNEIEIKYITSPVLHSEDISSVVIMNHVDILLKSRDQVFQGNLPFTKKITKPIIWKKNIHYASFLGDESSVIYSLHLLPILLNCPDEDGNTPAHKASLGDRSNIIQLLFNLGADFRLVNKNGLLPHQIAGGKNSVLAFQSLGFNLNERDSNGNSLLELKTVDFNWNVIETLLKIGTNIFEPNMHGNYWMQLAIHGEYYKEKMNFEKFQTKVRKIIQKNFKSEVVKDPIIKEILSRKVKQIDEEDTNDINNSVTRKDVNRINILLALGAHADRVREDGKTNLMLCAERNDSEIATILANNFCDVNFKNKKGENTFWVASYLMNFDTAIVLRDHGSDINSLSFSGNTILHVSYEEQNNSLFYFLLDSGCSPNIKNKNKESVLFQAFCGKDDKVAEVLQERYNGDINTQAQDDNSLAHIAILDQDMERLDYYIQRGINLEIKNSFGYTIFMISIIIFDNLQDCSTLLSYGCDINTQDFNGNTPLLNILHSKKFNKTKFDFLINNNCNINLQNCMGEFPISVCIIRELNDVAQFLLDKGCIINDHQSEFEPIASALKINSQYWFETLLQHGASASNVKYPVLASYINSNFFNFELMKIIKDKNVVIGGPIQAALRKNYFDIAHYLWDISDEQTRLEITKTVDSFGMIPISVAIVYGCISLVNILLSNKNYDVKTPDKQNRTPFSYACQSNQIEWMHLIFSRITIENANLVDTFGNSALTYSARNNNIKFCNFLFVNNIEVFNIGADQFGIIYSYQKIIIKYNELKKIALYHYDSAEREYDGCYRDVSHWSDEISSLRSEIRSLSWRDSDDSRARTELRSAESCLRNAEYQHSLAVQKRDNAERIRDEYERRYKRICKFTRNDLLNNFQLAIELANRINETSNCNDLSFLDGVSSILRIFDH